MKFLIYVMLLKICDALEPMSETEYVLLFGGAVFVSLLEEFNNSSKHKDLIERIKKY